MKKRAYTEEQRAWKNEQTRAWNSRNRQNRAEQLNKASRQWQRDNPARVIFNGMVASSKKRGHVMKVTFEQVQELLAPMECSLTGRTLAFGAGNWAPSIDCIDSSLGYVIGNLRLTAWCINRALSNQGEELLLEIAHALVAKQGL